VITVVKMPQLGWTMKEGKILKWLKAEGERVEKGEPLFIVETEKITNEIDSPGTGVLRKILIHEGYTAPVQEVLAVLAEPDEEIPDLDKMIAGDREVVETPKVPVAAKVEKPTVAKPRIKVKISPVAKKLAEQHGIDVTSIMGTGPGGRIIKKDVSAAIEIKAAPVEREVVPLTGARRVMAERLSYSAQTYAVVWNAWEVDVTDLVELRRKLRPQWEKAGLRISVTAFVVKAVAQALKENPIFNATLKDDNIIIHKNYNIGVAMAVRGKSFWEDNLLVGVISNADKKSLAEIAARLIELREKSNQKTLTMDDVSGSTFTISNFGALGKRGGGSLFTSLINPPESAILGIGGIAEKPVVREGKIVVRSIMNVMLTPDHRIIYPTDSMRFAQRITELLENPVTLLDESVIALKT